MLCHGEIGACVLRADDAMCFCHVRCRCEAATGPLKKGQKGSNMICSSSSADDLMTGSAYWNLASPLSAVCQLSADTLA